MQLAGGQANLPRGSASSSIFNFGVCRPLVVPFLELPMPIHENTDGTLPSAIPALKSSAAQLTAAIGICQHKQLARCARQLPTVCKKSEVFSCEQEGTHKPGSPYQRTHNSECARLTSHAGLCLLDCCPCHPASGRQTIKLAQALCFCVEHISNIRLA